MKARLFSGTKRALFATGLVLLTGSAWAQPAPDDAPPQAVAAAGNPSLPADISPGLAQVVKLAEANVGDEVILQYIRTSGQATVPTADEILYLKDLGVSDAVITALLQNPAPAAPPAPVAQPQPVSVPPPVSTSAPTEQVTTAYFEEQLSPYGSWVEVPEYGRCWQPSVVVVDHSWRPYSDRGHWVYTDAGWYWQSDYSWGWAAFHYGRWFNHGRYGWVWAPDNVWGPSWVCWRQTDVQCGWAPLPPGANFQVGVGLFFHGSRVSAGFDFGLGLGLFNFVGYDHFCDRNVRSHFIPRREVVNIYNRSTVINNYTIVNKTVVNHGISRERVAERSQRPVPRITLHETASDRPGRVDHISHTSGSLNVFRPTQATMASHVTAPHREPFVINRTTTTTTSRGRTPGDRPITTQTTTTRTPGRVTTERTSTTTVPSRATERTVPPATGHTPTLRTYTPPVQHTAPAPVEHVTPRATAPVHEAVAPARTVTAPSHNTEPFSNGRHAVEHPSYQPRVYTGSSTPAASTPHASSRFSGMASPHQSVAPSVSHGGTPTFNHSSAPAAPSAQGQSSRDKR